MGQRAKPIKSQRTVWRRFKKRDPGQQTRRQIQQRYRHPKVNIVMRCIYECIEVYTKEKPMSVGTIMYEIKKGLNTSCPLVNIQKFTKF